jgi:hypothetical protein
MAGAYELMLIWDNESMAGRRMLRDHLSCIEWVDVGIDVPIGHRRIKRYLRDQRRGGVRPRRGGRWGWGGQPPRGADHIRLRPSLPKGNKYRTLTPTRAMYAKCSRSIRSPIHALVYGLVN